MAGTPEMWIEMYQNKLAASEKSVEAYGKALAKQANEKTQLQYRFDDLNTENTKLKDDLSKLEEYTKNCEKGTNQDQNQNSLTAYSAALEEETRQKTELQASKEELTNGLRVVQQEFSKLKTKVNSCEKATQKAQKEAKDAKGLADHRINSQKGQLKNAERNWDRVSRELRVWKEKYGTVDRPAEEKLTLQQSVTDLQSKAEEARNQITELETQIRGTPEQMGLHQALEQWQEHQGCSKEFMELEDKIHDLEKRENEMKSDLTAKNQKYQKAKADILSLQTQLGHATQGQDNTDYVQRIRQLESDLQASAEQNQQLQLNLRAVVDQLMQSQGTLQPQEKLDVNMSDDDTIDKAKLELYVKAFQEQHQQTESDNIALKAKADQLEQANKAFHDDEKTRNDMLEKLKSDLRTEQASHQATKSDKEVLQGEADELERDLGITKEQYQMSKSNMEALQEEVKTLQSDLETALGEHQTMESNVGIAKKDLETAKHEHQKVKSELEDLQGKAHGLEESNQLFQKKQKDLSEEMENYRQLYEASQKAQQDKNRDHEMADVKEGENELLKQQAGSSKPELDIKTHQNQVSSAAHTTCIDFFLSRIARTSFSC